MATRIQQRLAPGIYRLKSGSYYAKVSYGGRRNGGLNREKTFPALTSIKEMKDWQDIERGRLCQAGPKPVTGTLGADSERYLKEYGSRLKFPGHRKCELASWKDKFGHRLRHTIKSKELSEQVAEWRAEKVAESTIRHRLSALSSVYKRLDGKSAFNPVRDVERPQEPTPETNAPPLADVEKVLAAFGQSVEKNNRGHKTLARAQCLAYTGMRPSELMRVDVVRDVFFECQEPHVWIREPGKGGNPHAVPLSPEGVVAFQQFIKAGAAGNFSTSAFHKSWTLACRKAGVPEFNPYKLRHSFATRLHRHVPLSDVQTTLGHKSSKTTQRYAAPENLPRLYEAVAKANR